MKKLVVFLMVVILMLPSAYAENIDFNSFYGNFAVTLPTGSVQWTLEEAVRQEHDLLMELPVKALLNNDMEFFSIKNPEKFDMMVQIISDTTFTYDDLAENAEVFLNILELMYKDKGLYNKSVEVVNGLNVLHYQYIINDVGMSDYFFITEWSDAYTVTFCDMNPADEFYLMQELTPVAPEAE